MRRWGRGGKTRDEVFIRPVPTVGNELNPLRNLGDNVEHTLEVPRPRTAARSTPLRSGSGLLPVPGSLP